jgi:transcriptional/translational regulatory protein YebC/TACO1
MSTERSFDNMLKEYLPYQLLREEMTKRDYFLSKVEMDQKWKGGELRVPFKGGNASSFAYGELTAEADIVEDRYVKGTLSDYKEIWGSMVFNDHDLSRHGDMETSFIKILPDTIEEFVQNMKELVSVNLLNGAHIVTCDVAGTDAFDVANGDLAGTSLAIGKVIVDRPARLSIGQYLEFGTLDVAGAALKAGYVKSIDMQNKLIEVVVDKALAGAGVDFTSDPVGAERPLAAGDKAFVRGALTANRAFTDLRSQLLSAANGGSATLFGVTKLAYPHTQAFNYDGSGISSANILEKIFDAYNETRTIGKGMPTEVIMSFKHLGNVMKQLETAREYTVSDSSANVYGWTEISVVGVRGQLKLVGVQEMDDDIMHILDWKSLKMHTNELFERRTSPEGRSFYEIRSTTGYKYIVDTRMYGDLIVNKPSHNGIIFGINY